MRLSTRNQLTGTITEVTVGTVMAVVKIRLDGGEQVVTSSITKDAVADLGSPWDRLPPCSSSPLR